MRTILALFAVFCLLSSLQAQKPKLIIDADTGNELDDVVAISRALLSDKFEIIGLTAAQWKHQLSFQNNTAEISWELNNTILDLMDKKDIPSFKGSEITVGRPWGGQEPAISEASEFIVRETRKIAENEKLFIVVLGPLTNIATAILTDPSIAGKISLHFIGTNYFEDKCIWNKSEFNVRNDLNAFDVVLNTKDLELHVMPANVSMPLNFDNTSSIEQLEMKEGISGFIGKRWKKTTENMEKNSRWVMWDLAIINALINPQWVTKKEVATPPENVQRPVMVYTWIDHEKMREDFWKHF